MQKLGVFYKYWFWVIDSVYYCRYVGIVLVMDLNGFMFLEIYIIQVFDEGCYEVLVCLFFIVDDIDVGLLLILKGYMQGVFFVFDQFFIFEFSG